MPSKRPSKRCRLSRSQSDCAINQEIKDAAMAGDHTMLRLNPAILGLENWASGVSFADAT